MDTPVPALENLVLLYRELRDEVQEKETAHKEAMATLRESLDTVSAQLLEVCNETGAESIRTAAGTVSRRIQSRFWSADWEEMHAFIVEHEAPFLLEQRIHNANMKQFLDSNPALHPPGLQADRKYIIHVRKPTVN